MYPREGILSRGLFFNIGDDLEITEICKKVEEGVLTPAEGGFLRGYKKG